MKLSIQPLGVYLFGKNFMTYAMASDHIGSFFVFFVIKKNGILILNFWISVNC